MGIIPAINGKFEQTKQKLILPKILTVSQGFEAITQVFCTRMQGLNKPVQISDSPYFSFLQNENLASEEYILTLNENEITAEFSGEKGLNNALITFYMLAAEDELYCGYIHDYPKYSYRGMHIDTARHFFEEKEIEKIIEQLALLKINYIHWHFADDQAWRLEIKEYPKLTAYCGKQFYTQAQAARLVKFASDRGVQIVPEFEIPAHSTALISAYPSASCRCAKVKPPTEGGVFSIIMCAGKDETLSMIQNIIAELCQIFTGEYFHIGGDEAPKREWKACPLCNKRLITQGLASYENLQGYLLNYAADILKNKGKKVICWNDSLKADNLNKDIIVQYWQHKRKAKTDSSRKLIFSNVFTLYFDYPYCISNLFKVYNYTPKIKGARAERESILGIEAALWTERISTNAQLEYMLFPRAAALAENAWCKTQNYGSFVQSLKKYYTVLEKAEINAAPLKNAQVKGAARLWQLFKFSGTLCKALICLILPQKVEF